MFAVCTPRDGRRPAEGEIDVLGRADREMVRRAESGRATSDVCRELWISEATSYLWRKKFAHLGVRGPRRLRSPEDENTSLKRVVADLTLD